MSSRGADFEDVLRGAVAGVIGGCIASWVMNQYLSAQRPPANPEPSQACEQGGQSSQQSQESQKSAANQGDDATVKTAQAISRGLFNHELTPQEKKVAGPAVHYGYGMLVGGLYGALAEVWAPASAGFGMVYGMALWLFGDETAVPVLGLGPPPTQVAARDHADYLAGHLVYGIALDISRRFARLFV